MKELGYDIEYYLWVGLFAPKGTPADVVIVSAHRCRQGRAHRHFKAAMANLGQDVDYLDAPEFAKFWDADAERIEAAVEISAACKANGKNTAFVRRMRRARSSKKISRHITGTQSREG